jgi:hypothetical protein
MRRDPDSDVATAIELAGMCETFKTVPSVIMSEDPLILRVVAEALLAQKEKSEMGKGQG